MVTTEAMSTLVETRSGGHNSINSQYAARCSEARAWRLSCDPEFVVGAVTKLKF